MSYETSGVLGLPSATSTVNRLATFRMIWIWYPGKVERRNQRRRDRYLARGAR